MIGTTLASLNEVRKAELLAISKYMQGYYVLSDNGYSVLADALKKIAVEEMHHAKWLAERIVQIHGIPSMDALTQDYDLFVENIYTSAVELERKTIQVYTQAIASVNADQDYVSERLLKKILAEEVAHSEYFSDITGILAQCPAEFLALQVNPKFTLDGYAKYIQGGRDD